MREQRVPGTDFWVTFGCVGFFVLVRFPSGTFFLLFFFFFSLRRPNQRHQSRCSRRGTGHLLARFHLRFYNYLSDYRNLQQVGPSAPHAAWPPTDETGLAGLFSDMKALPCGSQAPFAIPTCARERSMGAVHAVGLFCFSSSSSLSPESPAWDRLI